jgi:hypothetical protein
MRVCIWYVGMRVLGCVYGIAHRELHTCAALSSQRSTYTLGEDASDEGTQQAFAESIAANTDIALVDLQGVDLSPCVDVLSVPDELRGNRAILAPYEQNESRSSK